jgi:hypothetical protein
MACIVKYRIGANATAKPLTTRGQTKFTPANLQQITNLAERGKSRAESPRLSADPWGIDLWMSKSVAASSQWRYGRCFGI